MLPDPNLEDDRRAEPRKRAEATTPAILSTGGETGASHPDQEPQLNEQDRAARELHLALAREEVQTALRQSKQRFRATFEQAAVGMAHVAPDGTWLRANRKFSEIVGYSLQELSQLRFEQITHPDDRDASRRLALQLLEGRLETASLQKRYVRKDGSTIWINLTTSLVRDDAGQPD